MKNILYIFWWIISYIGKIELLKKNLIENILQNCNFETFHFCDL